MLRFHFFHYLHLKFTLEEGKTGRHPSEPAFKTRWCKQLSSTASTIPPLKISHWIIPLCFSEYTKKNYDVVMQLCMHGRLACCKTKWKIGCDIRAPSVTYTQQPQYMSYVKKWHKILFNSFLKSICSLLHWEVCYAISYGWNETDHLTAP